MSAREGVALLYVTAGDWLSVAGVPDPFGCLDKMLAEEQAAAAPKDPGDRTARSAEIAAFVAATGG